MLPDIWGKVDHSWLSPCSWLCLFEGIADKNYHSLSQQIALVMNASMQILFEGWKTWQWFKGRDRKDNWKGWLRGDDHESRRVGMPGRGKVIVGAWTTKSKSEAGFYLITRLLPKTFRPDSMARRICCVLGLSPELELLDGLVLNFQSSWNILGKFVVAIPWNGNSSRLALSRWQSPEFPQIFNSGQNTDTKAALALGIYISKVPMKSLDFEALRGHCRGANNDWRDDKQTETRPEKSEIYICSFHVSSSPASRACFKNMLSRGCLHAKFLTFSYKAI